MPVVKEIVYKKIVVKVHDEKLNLIKTRDFIEGNDVDLVKYKQLWTDLKNSKNNLVVIEKTVSLSRITITRKEVK